MASSTIFWVFGMIRPGIEPRSPWPLVNTLTIMPIAWLPNTYRRKIFFLSCSRHCNQGLMLLETVFEGDQKAPFSIATTLRCRGGHCSFPWKWCLEWGLIVVYYFHIWNKKEYNINICRVISVHMGSMYVQIPCIKTINQYFIYQPQSKIRHFSGNLKGSSWNYIDNLCLYHLIQPA